MQTNWHALVTNFLPSTPYLFMDTSGTNIVASEPLMTASRFERIACKEIEEIIHA
jgi:hypothetical protein